MDATAVRMPKLADTLVEGTVARWLKAVGDHVSAGEPLVEIETDKVSTELAAPAGGVLTELVVAEGQTVPIDAVIARIGGDETPSHSAAWTPSPEAATPVSFGSAPVARSPHPDPLPEGEGAIAPSPSGRGRDVAALRGVRAGDVPAASRRPTSVAARLLAEHNLSAEQLGDVAAGRVTKQDVQRYLQSQAATPAHARADTALDRAGDSRTAPTAASILQPVSPMRRAIADHMAKARATIPHGQTVMEADLTRLVAWREQEKAAFEAREGARLTLSVFFLLALGRALGSSVGRAAVPALAGADTPPPPPGTLAPPEKVHPAIDIGVAVALDDGLIVPVVRSAEALSLGEVARAVDDLAARARAGRLLPSETRGALMTVTNVGSFGNLAAFPILPLGQAGILGPGIVEQRPLTTPGGGVRLGWRCLLALVFDRRLLTDLAADRLLRAVVDELDRFDGNPDHRVGAAG